MRKPGQEDGMDLENVRVHVIIEGRVQGVLFRHHTQEVASRLGLKGWVKNRPDGNVEAIFEGNPEKVNQIIRWCHQGPSQAKVTKVRQMWEDYRGEFNDFSVSY